MKRHKLVQISVFFLKKLKSSKSIYFNFKTLFKQIIAIFLDQERGKV